MNTEVLFRQYLRWAKPGSAEYAKAFADFIKDHHKDVYEVIYKRGVWCERKRKRTGK